jgi:dihydroorotate dehydrogenase electron transfer subunit
VSHIQGHPGGIHGPPRDRAPRGSCQLDARILVNQRIARDTYLLRLDAAPIARVIRPGQFVMVRPSSGLDPLLGRPFALYDVVLDASGAPMAIDIVYLILGRGTATLATQPPGAAVSVWGPLGNGFGAPPVGGSTIAFVAGGIGQTPFLALAKSWLGRQSYGTGELGSGALPREIVLYYGVRDADLLAGLDDFLDAGLELRLSTDDGSVGHHGFVTEALAADLDGGYRPDLLLGCGPPPMLAALARLARDRRIACELSLENHMACGFGACFSCVARIRQGDGTTDLKRVCVEGPVFPAESVVW